MRATIFVAVMVLAACGPQNVGSKYVAEQKVGAASGGALTVASSDSKDLAGLTLTVPAGALNSDTTITVELGNTLLATGSAGPSALFGPSGLVFHKAARLTMPISKTLTNTRGLFIQGQEEDGTKFTVAHSGLAIDTTAHTVSFDILSFTTFQPGIGAECAADNDCGTGEICQNATCVVELGLACTSNAGCSAGYVCTNGSCAANQDIDGGSFCSSDADCGQGYLCERNTCIATTVDDGGIVCASNNDCATGQVCTNGACTTVDADGGLSCNTDSDCGQGFSCVRNTCISTDSDGGQPDGGLFCSTDTDCPTGSACFNNQCVDGNITDGGSPDGGNICTSDANCMSGDVCINGGCFQAIDGGQGPDDGGTTTTTRCMTNNDCAPGQNCVNNICMSP